MKSLNLFLSFLSCFLMYSHVKATNISAVDSLSYNTIEFEKSTYGLIFTKIWIDGEEINAMIDFGDPNVLQLSTSIVDKLKLSLQPTGHKAYFITGEAFDIHEGTVDKVKIGNQTVTNVSFSSSPNEMESVSEQIGTTFNAVVGWGYFKKYYTVLDYEQRKFEIYKDYTAPKKVVTRTYFDKSSSYLSIPINISGHDVNAIIDTGSPVTIVDKTFLSEQNINAVKLKIDDVPLFVQTHAEDLSMLSDLGVKAIIGGDVLQMFKILIDPFASEILFY